MEVSINKSQLRLISKQRHEHGRCVLCGPAKILGKDLEYQAVSDGSVSAQFRCDDTFQSYPGIVHGGVISLLLDGAMTNCLFAKGKRAVTGGLTIRFLSPVATGRMASVRARVVTSHPPLHILDAEITQDDIVRVQATGKFMECSPTGNE
jgi:uncharacterized protein (TIGR00369 family)